MGIWSVVIEDVGMWVGEERGFGAEMDNVRLDGGMQKRTKGLGPTWATLGRS
jgi:hypothetical protein